MTNIHFISNSAAKKHSNGSFHPESASRIEAIESWLIKQTDKEITYEIQNQSATEEEIVTVHSTHHYKLIEKTQGHGGQFYFDADTGANDFTFKAATQAVAVGNKAIFESDRNNSIFALVRPPGHHATRTSPMGFCIFNNIAIASELALQKKKYQRIAIIDFDHHFGNGTAYIHEKNPNILYISTHASPRIAYPGSGFVDEISEFDAIENDKQSMERAINDKKEGIMREGASAIQKSEGREATAQELEDFYQSYSADADIERDAIEDEFNLVQPHEGLDVVETGYGYGDLPQGIENAGDGMDDNYFEDNDVGFTPLVD